MDIGRLHDNHEYYDGFEGEEEIMISLVYDPSVGVRFWNGYLFDILQKPDLSGKGWKGFTRDYHQMEGAFSLEPDNHECYDPEEYLEDISQYSETRFEFEDSENVLQLIIGLLEYAVSVGSKIKIRVM